MWQCTEASETCPDVQVERSQDESSGQEAEAEKKMKKVPSQSIDC